MVETVGRLNKLDVVVFIVAGLVFAAVVLIDNTLERGSAEEAVALAPNNDPVSGFDWTDDVVTTIFRKKSRNKLSKKKKHAFCGES